MPVPATGHIQQLLKNKCFSAESVLFQLGQLDESGLWVAFHESATVVRDPSLPPNQPIAFKQLP